LPSPWQLPPHPKVTRGAVKVKTVVDGLAKDSNKDKDVKVSNSSSNKALREPRLELLPQGLQVVLLLVLRVVPLLVLQVVLLRVVPLLVLQVVPLPVLQAVLLLPTGQRLPVLRELLAT